MSKKGEDVNKGHKHLFGTSEKSDFILNMTADGAQKMCGVYSIAALLIIAVAAIPAYFTQTVSEYVMDDGQKHYLSENFIFYAGAAVMLAGFVGLLVFMIACSKKQVSIKDNKALICVLLIMLVSAAGCITAVNLYSSLLGYLGRHEGLITVIGYWGLFCVAMSVTAENRRIRLSDLIVGIGFVQSAAAILQIVPATAPAMRNFFEYLYVRPGTSPEAAGEIFYEGGVSEISGIYTEKAAASGFATSPYALAAIVSVAFAFALAGAAFDDSKKRRIIYGAASPFMAAAACLTKVLPGVTGICAGAVIVLAFAAVRSFAKGSQSRSPIAVAAVLTVCAGVAAGALFGTGTAGFSDEEVIFTDGYVMRSITPYGREDYEKGIYSYLRDDALYVAGQNPVLGVGCDNQPYVFSKYGTVTDRFYNEYLDMAASRGWICLSLYAVFLLISVFRAVKAFRQFISKGGSWIAAAAPAGAAAYLIQAFFNTTWVNSTPYLYVALGLIWSFGAVKDAGIKDK